MYYARIRFGFLPQYYSKEDAEERVYDYFRDLMQGGQIIDEFIDGWTNQGLEVHTYLQGYTALAPRNHTKQGRVSRKKIVEFFGQEPELEILDPDIPKSLPAWRKASNLLLFTTAWDHDLPIRTEIGCVPTYLLPVSQETKMQIYFWQQSYRRVDEIWFDCGDLETPAYKQLAEPTSELSKRGRELCQEIEKATRIPTYYYLMRHWGDSRYDAERVCPGCGGKWRIYRPNPIEIIPFGSLSFRCESCRLVSNEAFSMDEDRRRAMIGLWKTQ